MTNIEELKLTLKELNKRNIIFLLCIFGSIGIIIIGFTCKIPNLNGGLVVLGTTLSIIFGIIKYKNNNKIFQTKKQIYDIETITKAMEDSKK